MTISNNLHEQSAIGYSNALNTAKSHYENFPVLSFLVPKRLRKHIAIIYWFARTADDIADEGDKPPEIRIIDLNQIEQQLKQALSNKPDSVYFTALSKTINNLNLTPKHFFDLLYAFKQDVVKKRYNNFDEVQDYCNHSANPVGRLILELFDIQNEDAFRYSDKICTALQLTNFFQDTKIDFQKSRIYYPLDEMEKFGVSEKMFELNENNLNLQKLVQFNVERAQLLFNDGKELLKLLKGRLKFEVSWTIKGGETILYKIAKNNYDMFNKRQKLNKTDFVKLFFASIFN